MISNNNTNYHPPNPCLLLSLFLFLFFYFIFWHFFNASLLQTYIHGAPEDMRHWYSQHFIRHKHGMNEHTGKREVDESIISLHKKKKKKKKKRFVRLPPGRETWTWAAHLSIVFLYFFLYNSFFLNISMFEGCFSILPLYRYCFASSKIKSKTFPFWCCHQYQIILDIQTVLICSRKYTSLSVRPKSVSRTVGCVHIPKICVV